MLGFLLFVSLAVLLLAIPTGVIVLWISVGRLTRRVAAIEERLAAVAPVPSAPPLPASVPAAAPAAVPAAVSALRAAPREAPTPTFAAAQSAAPRLPIAPRQHAPAREPAPAPAPATREEWEVVVGTNWLNKIGVLVFVLGVAFLIAYSFAHVGPAGRIALGYAIGIALLASGVVLQRQPPYRSYAYGLVAGGWAAVYFTTFAMHGVPAARILQSEVAAVAALVAVAGAMIAHSLVYRSQTVTALAYVVAYGTLAITPLSGFSAVASMPLTASLLAVSARLRWPAITVVGLVSTYLIFAIREQVFPGPTFDPRGLTRYVLLGVYWLLFEAADVMARRPGPPSAAGLEPATAAPGPTGIPLMALNAIGLLGTMLIQVPVGDETLASRVIGAAAVAYLASGLVRAVLVPSADERIGPSAGTGFTSVHGAVGVSAALFAWTAGLRFDGPRETLLFLLEAQLLVAAGMALGDVVLRRIGAWVAMLVSLSAWLLAVTHVGSATELSGISAATPVVLLVAAAWYANDTWLRRRGMATGVERGYTWIALALTGLVIGIELSPAHQGPAVLMLSALLLERAFRSAGDYREQAFLTAGIGFVLTLQHFALAPEAPGLRDVWSTLPIAAVLCYGFAWRVARGGRAGNWQVNHLLGGTLMSWAGTTCVAVLLWRAMPEAAVGLAWMSVALLCGIAGVRSGAPPLRWQGYVLAGASALHMAPPLLEADAADDRAVFATAAAALACAMAVVVRGGLASQPSRGTAQEQRALSATVAAGVTLLLLVVRVVLPTASVAAGWAAVGLVMAAGPWRRAPESGWLAAAALGASALRTLDGIARAGTGDTAHVVWSAVVIGLLYAAAFMAGSATAPRWEGEARVTRVRHGVLIVSATLLLTLLTLDQLRSGLVTPAWGLQGMALLVVGFLRRDRLVRLSGLAVLLACLVKLFGYDVQTLEPLARIFSFVVLGMVLLAVSWGYTKYRATFGRLFKETAGPQDPA